MTGAFILLLVLYTPSSTSGLAVTSAEFASKTACEAAGKTASRELPGFFTSVRFVCVPKEKPQ